VRSAIQSLVRQTSDRELDENDGALFRARRVDACSRYVVDLRVGKDRRVELGCLLGPAVEPTGKVKFSASSTFSVSPSKRR
jgi:hypothetical protein